MKTTIETLTFPCEIKNMMNKYENFLTSLDNNLNFVDKIRKNDIIIYNFVCTKGNYIKEYIKCLEKTF